MQSATRLRNRSQIPTSATRSTATQPSTPVTTDFESSDWNSRDVPSLGSNGYRDSQLSDRMRTLPPLRPVGSDFAQQPATPRSMSGTRFDSSESRVMPTRYTGRRALYSWSRDEKDMPKLWIQPFHEERGIAPLFSYDSPLMYSRSLSSTTRSPTVASMDSTLSDRSSSRPTTADSSRYTMSTPSSSATFAYEVSSASQHSNILTTPHHPRDPSSIRTLPHQATAAARQTRQDQPGPSTLPSRSRSRSPSAQPETEEPVSESDWKSHAKVDARTQKYTCMWPVVDEDGQESICSYHSKKHLVKRHIESVHLHIKTLICKTCGKAFSQQTNLNTHMNTHTGDMPHKCLYDGCEKRFGDPARRHRHMKKVHKHVPSRRRTQGGPDAHWAPESTVPPPEDSPVVAAASAVGDSSSQEL
ncbi:hypothetical protein EIP91_001510 [Steccherinum ochraceum]|uniref:C2H2-type domain-containing protein n=1 Tax=Steccherinum ochraceum TaxID=92696 RepID=A0A4R0RPP6_9APHY|nr:hypothetical protein EIP91_001510 [Steccherinum ochraceum]